MSNHPAWGPFAALALAIPVMAGCPAEVDPCESDDPPDTCTPAPDPCEGAGIKGTPFPADGATDVYYRTTFSIEFLRKESDNAEFVLEDASGTAITLGAPNWSDDGKAVYFQSAEPLTPSTAYTLTATYCDRTAPIGFTTSDVGAPVDSGDFVGTSYGIDIGTALIIEPPGVNQLLGSLLGSLEDTIVVVPESYDDVESEISFFGGLAGVSGSTYTQDTCTPTIVFPENADYSADPFFEIAAPDGITLAVEGFEITLLALNLSGSFAPGGTAIVGTTLAGEIDTRDIASLIGDELGGDDSDAAVCNLVSTFTSGAVSCSACSNGAGDFCLALVATNIHADALDGFDLDVITDTDVLVGACQ